MATSFLTRAAEPARAKQAAHARADRGHRPGPFAQRGLGHVTVAEIAREAGVAEKTVFNDFPTTGHLVYWRLEGFEAQLLAAIRERPVGASALDACGRIQTAQRGWLAAKDPQARESMIAVARMISDSPALIAREQRVFERCTESLAALLAEESQADAGDVAPWIVTSMRRGVARARLAREAGVQAQRTLDTLVQGLGGYAVKGGDGRADSQDG
jgi:AcrR family transcriptional regulator